MQKKKKSQSGFYTHEELRLEVGIQAEKQDWDKQECVHLPPFGWMQLPVKCNAIL